MATVSAKKTMIIVEKPATKAIILFGKKMIIIEKTAIINRMRRI